MLRRSLPKERYITKSAPHVALATSHSWPRTFAMERMEIFIASLVMQGNLELQDIEVIGIDNDK